MLVENSGFPETPLSVLQTHLLKSEHHQKQVPATSQHVYNGTITTNIGCIVVTFILMVCIIIYNLVQETCLVKLPLVSWSIAPFLIFGCLIYSDKVKATPPDAALITWQRVLCLISRSCTAFSIGENLLILVQLILQRLLYSCCSKTSFIQHSFIKHISHLV